MLKIICVASVAIASGRTGLAVEKGAGYGNGSDGGHSVASVQLVFRDVIRWPSSLGRDTSVEFNIEAARLQEFDMVQCLRFDDERVVSFHFADALFRWLQLEAQFSFEHMKKAPCSGLGGMGRPELVGEVVR